MAKRVIVGDVFEVKLSNSHKQFVQYIGNDTSQLNSDLVCVFKKKYPIDEELNLYDITTDDIKFCAHVSDVQKGEDNKEWRKIGLLDVSINHDDIIFRDPNSQMKAPVSDKWFIWKIGDERKLVNFTNKLVARSDIGIVMSTSDVVYKMKFGAYPFIYPKYPDEK